MKKTPGDDWRYRLRGDPGNWLLDAADNSSVYFWFQRDIVGRPENAPALEQAREQILYSRPVQDLFASQDPNGFWLAPTSLDLPRYRATLWSLAMLSELGIPRSSRRARAACEFILQNHVNSDGAFTGLRELDYAGLAAHALLYFLPNDSRLFPILDRLAASAAAGNVFALWALAESVVRRDVIASGSERLLDLHAAGKFQTIGAFPSFCENDALLALRVLILAGRAGDPRTASVIEEIWARQGEGARWNLDKSYNGMLGTTVEDAQVPSKWATLNVLRVVTKL